MLAAATLAWPLLLGMAMLMLGNGLQGTLLGVRATSAGFTPRVTGLVMAGYFAGFFAGSLLAPPAIASVGHLRVFAALTAFGSAAILVHSVFVEPWLWGAMRLVTGFSYAGIYIVAESWLNERVTNEHRGGLLSVYMVITYLGMGGGQLLLNMADPDAHDLFILVSVLVSLASVPILLTVTRLPEHGRRERLGPLALLRVSRLGTLGCLFTGVAQGALFAMGAVYGRGIGLTVAQVSLLMATVILGGAVAQWPLGMASDRLDRRRVIVAVAFAGVVAAGAAVLVQAVSFAALLAAMALVGAACLTLYSLFNAHTNDRLRQEHRVAASSGLILFFGIGAVLGPPAGGWLMARAGPSGLLLFIGAMLALTGAFALYRRLHGKPVPATARTHYIAVAARTPELTAAMVEDPEQLAAEAAGGTENRE